LFWDLTTFGAESFETLRLWFRSGDASKFDLALNLLRGAPGKLAFSHRDQILETLEAADKLGDDYLRRAIGYLVSNAQGSFSFGLASEQSAEIADLGTSAKAALADPDLHPLLRRLYEAIKASAAAELRPFSSEEDEEEF
jgi:hypothetical protein